MSYLNRALIIILSILLVLICVEIIYYYSLGRKIKEQNVKSIQNSPQIQPSIINGEDIGHILTSQLNTSLEQAQDSLLKSSTKEDIYEGKIIEIDTKQGTYKTFAYESALKIQGNKTVFFPHFNKRDISNMSIIRATDNTKLLFQNLKIGDRVRIALQTNNLEYFTINTIKIFITVL